MESDLSSLVGQIRSLALGGEFSPALEDIIAGHFSLTQAAVRDISAVVPFQYALVLAWVAGHQEESPPCGREGHPWSCVRETLLPKTEAYEEFISERHGPSAGEAYRELMLTLLEPDEPPDSNPANLL